MITDKAHPSQYAFIGDGLPQTSVATVPIRYESRLAKLKSNAEVSRELTYCLCTLCERNKPWREALACKDLGVAWPEFTRLVAKAASTEPGRQAVLRRLDAMLEPTKQAILAPPP